MANFLRAILCDRPSRLVGAGALLLAVVYLASHCIQLTTAGATAAQVTANVLGDPGKHLYHIVVLPVAMAILVHLVRQSMAGRSARERRAFGALVGLLVGVCAVGVYLDHREAGFAAKPGDFSVPANGTSNPPYISDHADVRVRRSLVAFDAWARSQIDGGATAAKPALSDNKVQNVRPKPKEGTIELCAQIAPRLLSASDPGDRQDDRQHPPSNLYVDLPGAFCLLFAGAVEPDTQPVAEAGVYRLIWRDKEVMAAARPEPSFCGLLGPFLSILAAAFATLLVTWLFWLSFTGTRFVDSSTDDSARRTALLTVFVLSASWLLFGAVSAARTRYFVPTESDPLAMVVAAFVAVTGLTWWVTGTEIRLPDWAKLAVGGLTVAGVAHDLFLNSGRRAAGIAQRFSRMAIPFQILVTAMIVLAVVAAILRLVVAARPPAEPEDW